MNKNKEAHKAYNLLGWMFVAFTVLALLLLPQIFYLILNQIAPKIANDASFAMLLTYVRMYIFALPLSLLIIRKLPDKTSSAKETSFSIKQLVPLYLIAAGITTFLNLLAVIFEAIIGKNASATTASLAESNVPQWIFFLCGVIIAPIMEEVLFRWIPYKKLSGYGEKTYIVWSSIFFGLFHMNLAQSLYATALGFIFATITCRTGTIKYNVILHMTINFLGGVGIGSIIVRSNSQIALIIYGLFNWGIAIAGIVVLILFLRRKKEVFLTKDSGNFDHKALFNIPSILFYAFTIIMIIWSYFI
ncbi:membrane protease YdiL (CAAX protease family) [Enterococcus sp. PF1-24]|uniref:CPBP family intramembrane glutamic endopeptidase n=1 Tax=unclassified Enterococcus TaxID=2608891 RepID=UPI00247508C7|nr:MULTISPECIES: type II CAAX endopeptidase family protein [unclassified Enterococcus]MDH6364817.1 membrane protease YdiL (CAAX protease family) [Enterococcus sp. PFB1-1]MDH6401959.1 membrane protease YdiL (CAAX protease family) [Enterococcus sp. PF1-24]